MPEVIAALRRSEALLDGGPARTAVEIETPVGALWFDGDDKRITPLLPEHKSWEMDVVALLERTLRPGMTFVDIGAKCGILQRPNITSRR